MNNNLLATSNGSTGWRPDFRIQSKLPDVKLVRTAFLTNFICGLIFTFIVSFFIHNSYFYLQERSILKESQSFIEQHADENAQIVFQDSIFRKESRLISKINDFFISGANIFPTLIELANFPYEKMFIASMRYSESKTNMDIKNKSNNKKNASKTDDIITIEGSVFGEYNFSLEQINKLLTYINEISKKNNTIKKGEIKDVFRIEKKNEFKFTIEIELNNEITQLQAVL